MLGLVDVDCVTVDGECFGVVCGVCRGIDCAADDAVELCVGAHGMEGFEGWTSKRVCFVSILYYGVTQT